MVHTFRSKKEKIDCEMGTQEITSEQKEEIQQKIIDACKNDVGHVQKICSKI